jgi:copper resistance protein B
MSGVHASILLRAGVLGAGVAVAMLPHQASAQQMDHSKMHMPTPVKKPAPVEKPVRSKTPAKSRPKPVPVMDHSAMGHDMPMDHSTMPAVSVTPTQPITPIPVLTDTDRAAAVPPAHDHPVHDNSIRNYVVFDRLEVWNADKGTGMAWEGQSWIGTDLNRLWLRSEGERVAGRTDKASLEVLYGRSLSPWWDVVTGVRHDFKPGASQDFAAIGVMGLAPYKFEVAATAYIGQSGQTSARIEVEYETLLTNRLILQPLVELNLYGQDDARRGIGSGLGTIEAGLRLRYEVSRQFAPYVGIVRERAFGRSADFRSDEGEHIDDTRFVAGLRFWY